MRACARAVFGANSSHAALRWPSGPSCSLYLFGARPVALPACARVRVPGGTSNHTHTGEPHLASSCSIFLVAAPHLVLASRMQRFWPQIVCHPLSCRVMPCLCGLVRLSLLSCHAWCSCTRQTVQPVVLRLSGCMKGRVGVCRDPAGPLPIGVWVLSCAWVGAHRAAGRWRCASAAATR